jgi:hypothetical protein
VVGWVRACVHWMNLNIGGIVDNILIVLYVNLLMSRSPIMSLTVFFVLQLKTNSLTVVDAKVAKKVS